MSMVEAPAASQPKPRRKTTKRRKRTAAPKTPSDLAGLTVTDCPTMCSEKGCVLSAKFYCAHPYKGGLQGLDMHNEAAITRLDAARKLLGKAKIKLPKLG